MIPTIQHYLDAASRALAEVVAPALDPDNGFAAEQIALVQGILAIIGQQWRHAYALEALELKHLAQLVERLSKQTGTEAAQGDRLREILDRIAANRVGEQLPLTELKSMSVELRTEIDRIVEGLAAEGNAAILTQAGKMIADHSEREADLARAWFSGTRIDIHWSKLPSIEDALAARAER